MKRTLLALMAICSTIVLAGPIHSAQQIQISHKIGDGGRLGEGWDIRILSDAQAKGGNVTSYRGHVRVEIDTFVLTADRFDFDSVANRGTFTGNVILTEDAVILHLKQSHNSNPHRLADTRADQQTQRGDLIRYRGDVQIDTDVGRITADELDFNSTRQLGNARGHVSIQLLPRPVRENVRTPQVVPRPQPRNGPPVP